MHFIAEQSKSVLWFQMMSVVIDWLSIDNQLMDDQKSEDKWLSERWNDATFNL